MSNRYLGTVWQGVDEECIYSVNVANWGSSPSSPTVVVKDEDGADVTGDVTSGSASAAGNVITLPTIKSLTLATMYRVEVQFTLGSQVLEAFFFIETET